MKKLFIAALLALTVATSAFAESNKTANAAILHSFNSEFKKAENVKWTSGDSYVKASFILDNEKMEAFYSVTGEVIATSKSISLEELPVNAKRTFAKKYDGYTVKEAIYFEGQDENAFYISAENDKESVILKVSANAQLSTFKKSKK